MPEDLKEFFVTLLTRAANLTPEEFEFLKDWCCQIAKGAAWLSADDPFLFPGVDRS
jgi:hypothetical protein